MDIRSIEHRGLKRLIEDDESRELRRDLVARIRRVLTALVLASDVKIFLARPVGAFSSLQVIGLEHGILVFLETGALRLSWKIALSPI